MSISFQSPEVFADRSCLLGHPLLLKHPAWMLTIFCWYMGGTIALVYRRLTFVRSYILVSWA